MVSRFACSFEKVINHVLNRILAERFTIILELSEVMLVVCTTSNQESPHVKTSENHGLSTVSGRVFPRVQQVQPRPCIHSDSGVHFITSRNVATGLTWNAYKFDPFAVDNPLR